MAQTVDEFDWVGTLQAPASGPARATLPPEALMHLRSAQAADVRVFDAAGRPVAFAFATPPEQPAPPRTATAEWPALALHGQPGPGGGAAAAVQVRIDDGSGPRSVWVRLPGPASDPRPAAKATATTAGAADAARQPVTGPAATALPAAIFDTRGAAQTVAAVVVRARLPANTPVAVTLWSSDNLAQWAPVPLRGRLYRFDGDSAPANDTLELEQPLALAGRYLRLDWQGATGVAVESMHGLVAPARATARQRAPLPAPHREGDDALVWELGFATPVAALALAAPPGELLPVRVLGRAQASEPWRPLAQGVLYRAAGAGAASQPTELALPRASLRWLKVEATHGQRLGPQGLAATALFDPLDVVFVAGDAGPYRLAAGRADTSATHLPLSMLAVAAPGRLDALPQAPVVAQAVRPAEPPSRWQRLLPGGTDPRTALLWGVLLAGVAVLGAAAWALFRQLGGPPATPANRRGTEGGDTD